MPKGIKKVNKKNKVTKDMLIADVVENYHDAAEVFMMYGLACVGCHFSPKETVEQGAKRHGLLDEDIDQMIKDANFVLED